MNIICAEEIINNTNETVLVLVLPAFVLSLLHVLNNIILLLSTQIAQAFYIDSDISFLIN